MSQSTVLTRENHIDNLRQLLLNYMNSLLQTHLVYDYNMLTTSFGTFISSTEKKHFQSTLHTSFFSKTIWGTHIIEFTKQIIFKKLLHFF